jgi:hypothetical protein
MTTFTSAGTNTRKVDSVKPADDPVKPKTRILELLDEDFDFSSYNDANII